MTLAPPPAPCTACHVQHGGGPGPLRSLNGWQVARFTPVMAVPQQAADCGALETCGLERILEALKLLLSPGGERTDVGAGLHPGLSGHPVFQGCPGSHTVRPSGPPRDPGAPRPWGLWSLSSLLLLLRRQVPGGMGSVEY